MNTQQNSRSLYNKQFRDKAKRLGLCVKCFQRPRGVTLACEICRAKNNKYNEEKNKIAKQQRRIARDQRDSEKTTQYQQIIGLVFHNRKVLRYINAQDYELQCQNCSNVSLHDYHQFKRHGCKKCGNQPAGESGFRLLLRNYRNKKHKFQLTDDEAKAIFQSKCHYCGRHPQQVSKTYKGLQSDWSVFNYNGIDRRDNKLGYILSNCVPCCVFCNRAKSNKTYQEFVDYIRHIVHNGHSLECLKSAGF